MWWQNFEDRVGQEEQDCVLVYVSVYVLFTIASDFKELLLHLNDYYRPSILKKIIVCSHPFTQKNKIF